MQNNVDIILASTSPRRRQLMEGLRFEFRVQSPDFEEILGENEKSEEYVKKNALGKARSILEIPTVKKVKDGSFIVIGADTVVSIDDKILQKPRSKTEAIGMLEKLSGRSHEVFTGYSLIYKCQNVISEKNDCVKTIVNFKKLSRDEILSYVETGEPMDKAGAYGIQGKAAYFVSSIQGSYTNVMGLPLTEVYESVCQFKSV